MRLSASRASANGGMGQRQWQWTQASGGAQFDTAARARAVARALVRGDAADVNRGARIALRYAGAATRLRAVHAPAERHSPPLREAAPAHVRRATIGDLDALVLLEQATFPLDRVSVRQWRRHLESLSAEILVATHERRLIGAALVFYRRASKVARLYSIAVAAGEHGRGLGEALLVAAERAARKRGCRAMRLEVRGDNAAAQRLYERLGYHRFGMHREYYEDGHDAHRYEKALA